ncbi:hypothetical protein [Luteipulveratus halotolerans]|uniref:Uncharacterized protein n=1 Tax=Luteipulveratus halotolerans TaxID=1631356 RepID=A0A0L6CK11_9MICO|nr:hypothetical protein [Luteipulveratus halotolerans]KNX38069.1 hypothetical protein VV01_14425 [Luteipulveratus halotolerans]
MSITIDVHGDHAWFTTTDGPLTRTTLDDAQDALARLYKAQNTRDVETVDLAGQPVAEQDLRELITGMERDICHRCDRYPCPSHAAHLDQERTDPL